VAAHRGRGAGSRGGAAGEVQLVVAHRGRGAGSTLGLLVAGT
jgi:hypothetical protein